MKKSTLGASAPTKAAAPKALKPEKLSKTKLATLVTESNGKFFTSTHIDAEGNPCTMKARLAAGNNSALGVATVYVPKIKGYRSINLRTITNLITPDNKEYRS